MEEELKMEHALDILNRKVAKYIREHKEGDIEQFKNKLREFAKEEEKIYKLDEETIEKVIKEYLKDIKE